MLMFQTSMNSIGATSLRPEQFCLSAAVQVQNALEPTWTSISIIENMSIMSKNLLSYNGYKLLPAQLPI